MGHGFQRTCAGTGVKSNSKQKTRFVKSCENQEGSTYLGTCRFVPTVPSMVRCGWGIGLALGTGTNQIVASMREEIEGNSWVLEVKISLIFSVGKLILNNNSHTFKNRYTVSYEVANRWYCFWWSLQFTLFQQYFLNNHV